MVAVFAHHFHRHELIHPGFQRLDHVAKPGRAGIGTPRLGKVRHYFFAAQGADPAGLKLRLHPAPKPHDLSDIYRIDPDVDAAIFNFNFLDVTIDKIKIKG